MTKLLFLFNVAYCKKWTHAINFKRRKCHYCISDGYFLCVRSELLTLDRSDKSCWVFRVMMSCILTRRCT